MAALSKWVPVLGAPDQLATDTMKPPKLTTIDKIGGIYCHICQGIFGTKKEYDSHYVKHNTGSKDIVYTCVECHKEIVGYPSFRGHCYLKHVIKDKFKCEYCEKVFSKHCVLNTHIKAVHQFKCVTCQAQFKNQKELSIHQILHKNDQGPPYNCGTCGKQIDSTDDCEQHIEDHCSMTYLCPICDETISDIRDTASHLTKHFGNVLTKELEDEDEEPPEIKHDSSIDLLGGIFCCHCEQMFKARPDFDNHFLVEHADKPIVYACNICAKEFDKYLLFANHCYDHYAKGRFRCEVCFKSFPRLSLLVTHVEAHQSGAGAEATFPCGACERDFRTHRRLRDHQRTVHNLTAACHQCLEPACNKIFASAGELSRHAAAAHAGAAGGVGVAGAASAVGAAGGAGAAGALGVAGAARCRWCGLRFGSGAACARHVGVHRRAAYGCPVCARSYHEKYLVMKHVNQHFCSVLHICNICGKVYNARSRLNNHMKVHNEVKDHTCMYCGKGFTKVYLLKQHINIHTGLRPYMCTACPKTFANQANLAKHMKCMHNITKIDIKLCFNPNPSTKVPNPKPNTRIEKLKEGIMVYPEESIGIDNNNIESIHSEPPDNPASSETSADLYDTPSFDDSDETSWNTDSIDQGMLQMLEENIGNINSIGTSADYITELENSLWVQSPTLPTASPTSFLSEPCVSGGGVPREYGPEFVNALEAEGAPPPRAHYVQLDDHILPHIPPLLTISDARRALALNPHPGPPQDKWEPPVITKLYQDYQYPDLDARYSVMNTDIF